MDEKSKKLFLGLYQMLLSDTEIHPKELELLYKIGREKGLTEVDVQQAILSSGNLAASEELTDDEKIDYLYNLARMAWADGVIDERERVCLHDACRRFGFDEQYIVEITDFLLEQAKNGKTIEEVLLIIQNS